MTQATETTQYKIRQYLQLPAPMRTLLIAFFGLLFLDVLYLQFILPSQLTSNAEQHVMSRNIEKLQNEVRQVRILNGQRLVPVPSIPFAAQNGAHPFFKEPTNIAGSQYCNSSFKFDILNTPHIIQFSNGIAEVYQISKENTAKKLIFSIGEANKNAKKYNWQLSPPVSSGCNYTLTFDNVFDNAEKRVQINVIAGKATAWFLIPANTKHIDMSDKN